MDENNKPINAGIRLSKDEFIDILGVCDMEADENTVNYTFIGGKFVGRKKRPLVNKIISNLFFEFPFF